MKLGWQKHKLRNFFFFSRKIFSSQRKIGRNSAQSLFARSLWFFSRFSVYFFASRFSYCLRWKFVWILRHGVDAVCDPAKKKKQSGSVFTRSLFINRPCKIVLLHLKRPWRYYCSNLFIKVKAWNVITFFFIGPTASGISHIDVAQGTQATDKVRRNH